MRVALTLTLLVACSCGTRTVGGEAPRGPSRTEPDSDTGAGSEADAGTASGSAESRRAITHLALELSAVEDREVPPRTRVHLVITDETGASRRREVGTFEGSCEDVSDRVRGEVMHPFFGVECRHEGAGLDLRFVLREDVAVVLRAQVESKGDEEPYYDEHVRFQLPRGATVVID